MDVPWLLIFPSSMKGRGHTADCVEEDVPVLTVRIFPNKYRIDADGEWNSPVCTLTFNPKSCL